MDINLSFINDYLQGKSIYHTVRRILNLVFSISISSFLFERFYFKYDWLDVTDYKGIINFFIKGNFFVPFCIFIVVHYLLEWLSYITYSLMTYVKSVKIQRWIYSLEFKRKDAKQISSFLNKNPFNSIPLKIDEQWFLKIYDHLVKTIPPEQLTQMEVELVRVKDSNEKNFQFALKALVAISIYFSIIPYFGWKLYVLVVIILLMIVASLFLGFLLLENAPYAVRKFHSEVSIYIDEINEQQNGQINDEKPISKRKPKG